MPAAASAAPDPAQVNFTLQGCRIPAGETLPNAANQFVCADADYTTGNLGKNWNELDLVPHRLTASASAAQTYTVAITADNIEAGTPGCDVISEPQVNTALSTPNGCSVTADPAAPAPAAALTPGTGGTDTSLYRLLTITQTAGSTCVFDYYERLALGSSGFSGASLHSNLMNQNFGVAGVGARDVSIPVNAIQPQALSKTMDAQQGSAFVWSVAKDASPTDLNFANTCDSALGARQAGVTITVRYTKLAPAANGGITVVTAITLDNPAHRDVTANVSDTVFLDQTQTTAATPVTGTNPFNSGDVVVPALGTLTLTHSITVAAGAAASFNDVATATYKDTVANVPITGQTTAAASATVTTNNAANATATIADTETITGTGLSFSADAVDNAPAGSGFTAPAAYVLGTPTTGPLTYTTGPVSPPLGVEQTLVFHKTVYVDQARNTSGALSDVATLTDAAGTSHQATASTAIVARGCISGQKFADLNANGVKDPGVAGLAGVTIYLDLDANGSLDPGEPSAVTDANGFFSIAVAGVPDGSYPLREVLPAGQECTAPSPCFHTVVIGPGVAPTGLDFGNHPLPGPPPPPPPAPPEVPFAPVAPAALVEAAAPPEPAAPVVAQSVLGQTAVAGTAVLRGVSGCATTAFTASVTGRRIVRVRFYLDGRLVATVRRANGPGGRFGTRINPSRLANGTRHRVVARIQFAASSNTAQKIRSFAFLRCGRSALAPAFTG